MMLNYLSDNKRTFVALEKLYFCHFSDTDYIRE